jgi:transcriptional regulator with PAS, ATPase and Fis domain
VTGDAHLVAPIIGESPAIRRARDLIERYAPSGLPILLVGATGTGKELVAKHIHARSGRAGQFVAVNCGALPAEMVEGLLFGHRRGAFSGAIESRRGYLECSSGGTLFLDELLSLPASGQVKLLRALETGDVQPLGEEQARPLNLRVVGAVQEEVDRSLGAGTLRQDLFQRVAGIVITLTPLAERREDVLPLATYFAELQGRVLDPAAGRALLAHRWPGNVRELRQVIERAGHLVSNGTLPPEAIREAIALGMLSAETIVGSPQDAETAPERAVRDGTLVAACQTHAWHAARTAAALGISRVSLYRRLRAIGISLQEQKRLFHD